MIVVVMAMVVTVVALAATMVVMSCGCDGKVDGGGTGDCGGCCIYDVSDDCSGIGGMVAIMIDAVVVMVVVDVRRLKLWWW